MSEMEMFYKSMQKVGMIREALKNPEFKEWYDNDRR